MANIELTLDVRLRLTRSARLCIWALELQIGCFNWLVRTGRFVKVDLA